MTIGSTRIGARRTCGPAAAAIALSVILSWSHDARAQATENRLLNVCTKELTDRKLTVGMPGWREQMQTCMARVGKEWEPPPFARDGEMTPLGPGPVGSYMSALLAGDFVLARRMDRDTARHGAMVWPLAFSAYLSNYPSHFGKCLGRNPPSVVVGRVYDEVRTDRFGLETRERVDTRRRQPVKPVLLPIAEVTGAETFTVADEAALEILSRMPFMGEVSSAARFGRFSPGDFDRFAKQLMERLRCDDPVVVKLEQQMLRYFAMRDLPDAQLAGR